MNDMIKGIVLETLESLAKTYNHNEKILKVIQRYIKQVNDDTFDYQDAFNKGWEFLATIGIGNIDDSQSEAEGIQKLLEGDDI